MGPSTDADKLAFEVATFKREHPQIIIKKPAEVPSHMWEVSFPKSATIAFSDAGTMLLALSMIGIPEDDD